MYHRSRVFFLTYSPLFLSVYSRRYEDIQGILGDIFAKIKAFAEDAGKKMHQGAAWFANHVNDGIKAIFKGLNMGELLEGVCVCVCVCVFVSVSVRLHYPFCRHTARCTRIITTQLTLSCPPAPFFAAKTSENSLSRWCPTSTSTLSGKS